MTKEPSSTSPKTIDEYLLPLLENVQVALENLRHLIHSLVPGAEEGISYQIPVIKYKGHSLVGFAAYKNHCSFFVMSSPPIMAIFKDDLKDFKYSGSTIHFQPEKPLPEELIRKIVEVRIGENQARFGENEKTAKQKLS